LTRRQRITKGLAKVGLDEYGLNILSLIKDLNKVEAFVFQIPNLRQA
jgi:hypothetical protein